MVSLAVVVVAAFALVPVSATVATTSVGVAPDTNLVDGQSVTVSGSGFQADSLLSVALCLAPAGLNTCDTGSLALRHSDSNGAFSFTYTVRREVRGRDCADPSVTCVVGVADLARVGQSEALSFTPPGALRTGAIDVPPSPITVGTDATVDASGWAPLALVHVALCASNPSDSSQCLDPGPFVADGAGALTTTLTLHGSPLAGGPDCFVAGSCVFAAWDDRDLTGTLVTQPYTVALAPRQVTVAPATNLRDGDLVTVSGAGYQPGATLRGAECRAGATTLNDCDTATAFTVDADQDGAFRQTDVLSSLLHTANGTVDCTSAAGACVLGVGARGDFSHTVAAAALSFLVIGPPQRGTIDVTSPVLDGDELPVAGSGFASGAPVHLDYCEAAFDGTDLTQCFGTLDNTLADGTGAFQTNLFADAVLHTPNGDTTDCTVAGACVVAAWDRRDEPNTVATAGFTIAASPQGSVAVTPSTGLHDGDTVTVSGAGWYPGASLRVRQCDSPNAGGSCGNTTWVDADTDGSFSTPYPVQLDVADAQPPLDCSATLCWIVVTWQPVELQVSNAQPISFATTPVPVDSHYSDDELALLQQGASQLGIPPEQLQHDGAWALAWVLGITGTDSITPLPDTGTNTVTTAWPPSELSALQQTSTRYGATPAEFQKSGGLFVAYVLSVAG